MTLGEYLKDYRKRHHISMQEFSEMSGISKGYISMLERGQHPQSSRALVPSIETIGKIADAIGVSIEELLSQINGDQKIDISHKNKTYFRVPVLGHVAAGVPIEMIEDIVDWEDLPKGRFKEPEKEYFGLKIEGHSMEPQICNNDTVIVHKQPDAEDGQIVIAAVDGEYATCKRLKKYKDSIALVPINPNYSPLVFSSDEVKSEPVVILGIVLELRRGLT